MNFSAVYLARVTYQELMHRHSLVRNRAANRASESTSWLSLSQALAGLFNDSWLKREHRVQTTILWYLRHGEFAGSLTVLHTKWGRLNTVFKWAQNNGETIETTWFFRDPGRGHHSSIYNLNTPAYNASGCQTFHPKLCESGFISGRTMLSSPPFSLFCWWSPSWRNSQSVSLCVLFDPSLSFQISRILFQDKYKTINWSER